MLKEFKEFAMRGNVVDLAVGVIIGAAFGAIVNSLVTDVIMPPIGLLAGVLDFKDLFVSLNGQTYTTLDAAKKAGAPVIAYGAFLNTIVNFLIVAFAIFLLVLYVGVALGPPPPSAQAVAWSDMGQWLVILWAVWVDRHRKPVRAA